MKNTGQPAQDAFDAHWATYGKSAAVIPYEDAAALYGRNKKAVSNAAKPCDRVLIFRGVTQFCEIKSTHDKTAFRFSQIEKGQLNYGTKITCAGGEYNFWVWSYHMRRWHKLPFAVVSAVKGQGRESLKWSEMDQFVIALAEPTA
jgi:penicillin-binding protein-related factor A (putative recombinase)